MDFIHAFKLLKTGRRAARGEWMGKIAYWEYCGTADSVRQVMPDGTASCFDSVKIDDILADDWYMVT